MKLKWIGSLLILAGVVGCKTPDRPNLVEYVNPNIGTVHSRWFFYTPAAEPFGLAKLGASTNGTYGNNQGWEAVGYEDGHTSIDGFPCLHEFQIGGIALMPVTGEVKTNPAENSFEKASSTSSSYTPVYKSTASTFLASIFSFNIEMIESHP